MTYDIRKLLSSLALFALLFVVARPARAQLQVVTFGGAEWDTQEMELYLLGATVQQEGIGWSPTAGVIGYRLTVPIPVATGIGASVLTPTQYALAPSAGLRRQWDGGAVSLSAGYLFLSEADEEGEPNRTVGALIGGEEGVFTTLQANYWGTGALNAGAIVNYNWGSEYLWARGRAALPVARFGDGAFLLGAEAVTQGEDFFQGEETLGVAEPYEANQVGAVAEWATGTGLRLIGVVGYKTDNVDLPDEEEGTPYFKAEFVYVP